MVIGLHAVGGTAGVRPVCGARPAAARPRARAGHRRRSHRNPFPAADRARQRARHGCRGACALERREIRRSPVRTGGRAGLTERLSRAPSARHCACRSWTGPLAGMRLSINLLAEDLAREPYVDWLLTRFLPPAWVRPGHGRDHRSSLLADQDTAPAAGAVAGRWRRNCRRRLRHRLCQPVLSDDSCRSIL